MGYPMPFASLNDVREEMKKLVPQYSEITDAEKQKKTDGTIHFTTVAYTPPSEITEDGYIYNLITGPILQHLGAGTRSSRAYRLKKYVPQSFIEINELDAQELGIKMGDKVRIKSPIAEIITTARINNDLPEGTVFAPMSFPDSPVTTLFNIELDTETKIPSINTCSVKLERIELDE
jgi:predicted molibdopterin-dependent oxidoreductase YjgC